MILPDADREQAINHLLGAGVDEGAQLLRDGCGHAVARAPEDCLEGPMAVNLVKAGHTVRGFHLSGPVLKRLVVQGGQAAGLIADAVRSAAVVITVLPAGEHVLAAYGADDGILAHAVLVDSSTVPPEVPG